jgi:hypothetical protein
VYIIELSSFAAAGQRDLSFFVAVSRSENFELTLKVPCFPGNVTDFKQEKQKEFFVLYGPMPLCVRGA